METISDQTRRILAVLIAISGVIVSQTTPIDWQSPQLIAGLLLAAIPAYVNPSKFVQVKQ